MLIVQKYGGSSVATTEKIMAIANHLKKIKENGDDLVVVVSAMGKTTNSLIALSKEITENPDTRELDRLMSIGENQTIALLSIALNSIGVKAISFTGEQIELKTTGIHTKSRIKSINSNKIKEYIEKGYIVVVAGFQGVNENQDITTLGRGGSDTSAVAIASSLGCVCEIYTDVDGIYSIDPRIYEKAKKIDEISYQEMMELAYLGAGVMEPRAIELGYKYKVPIYVGKSLGEKNGTLIKERKMEEHKIKGISINENTLMVTIDNIPTYARNLEPIFKKAVELGINIDLISHNDVISENGSIAFTTPRTNVVLNKEVVRVSLVGIGIVTHIGVISRIFKVLSENNLSFHQISTSEISISLVVDEKNGKEIARLLASEFEL